MEVRKYEYLNVPLRVWEVDYNKLGSEGWLLVQLYYDRAWLVREVEPEITTKDLLRGAYEEPNTNARIEVDKMRQGLDFNEEVILKALASFPDRHA